MTKLTEKIKSEFSKMGPVWKVNTPQLLEEILLNPGTSILRAPLNIFLGILKEVAERAIEIDDTKLNELMLRLALIEPNEDEVGAK